MKLPERVTVYEVGPRDGLQNEARSVPTADKIAFIHALEDAGLSYIEITSFVSPQWIPQLADNAEVARGVRRKEGVVLSALVPNRRGLDGAIAAGMKEIAVFLSASETHNKKNINKTIAQTLEAFGEVIPPALAAGVDQRHDRRCQPDAGAEGARARARRQPAAVGRGSLPRHPGHRARELRRRLAARRHDDRCRGGRARRMSVRARGLGQPGDR
jgi:hypothetical protein